MKLIPVLFSFFILTNSFIKAQTTFNYTGAVQNYTVPACVYSITVDIKGAEGGVAAASPGGKGGRVRASLPVTPGEVLNIYVGGAPGTGATAGGWNGGGNAGTGGGAGGGASDIRRGTGLSGRIAVAAGGGGSGYPLACYNNTQGGHGGGLDGSDGWRCGSHDPYYNGLGGTQTAGGASGTANAGATDGTAGSGGIGGTQGGGGGGGYYGGGGGDYGGGGGGSSYALPSASNVVHTAAFQLGNGSVIITPAPAGPPAPGPISGPSAGCSGSTASYSVYAVAGATYNWTFPSGTVINSGSGTSSVEVMFGDSSGTIAVILSTSCGTSAPSTMNVSITPSLIADAGPDTTICKGSSTTLYASGGTAYTWTPFTGLSCINCQNPVANPAETTTYTVIVSDSTCASDSDQVTVNVITCTGTAQLFPEDAIDVFPNPADKVLYIKFKDEPVAGTTLELLNIQGQVVYSSQAKQAFTEEIDLSFLPEGICYLRIKSRDFVEIQKIMVR